MPLHSLRLDLHRPYSGQGLRPGGAIRLVGEYRVGQSLSSHWQNTLPYGEGAKAPCRLGRPFMIHLHGEVSPDTATETLELKCMTVALRCAARPAWGTVSCTGSPAPRSTSCIRACVGLA
jgi:hypothetical protein